MKMNQAIITEELQKLVDSEEMAGAALIVRKHGEELYRNTWGYANCETKVPVNYDTMYMLCSMSKPITAIATLILLEQGHFSLDDPLDKFLPEFAEEKVCETRVGQDGSYEPSEKYPEGMSLEELLKKMEYVPAKRKLTIRDLLTHSSGLGMEGIGLTYMSQVNADGDTLATRIAKWSDCPLDFQPGEGTGYSPFASMDILGHIVELVSSMEFPTFLGKKLFQPLGIKDITFLMSPEQHERFATLYKKEGSHLVPVPEEKNGLEAINAKTGYYSGAAGMIGSLEEYDKLTTMLACGGELNGVRILKEETVNSIYQERGENRLDLLPGVSWGLGMAVFYQPELSGFSVGKGTFGWSGAYGTHMFVHPESGISATFVMNREDIGGAVSPIARKVEELVFGTFLE